MEPGTKVTQPRSAGAPEWTHRPERGSALLMLVLTRLALAVGRSTSHWLLYPICAYFLVFAPRERKVSREYLRRVLGREPAVRDLFRHLLCFAEVLLDRVYLVAGRYSHFSVEVHGKSIVDDIAREGRGCLLLGAHLGSFEVPRFLGQEGHGLPVSLAMYEETARRMNAVYDALSTGQAMPVIALGKTDSMLRIEEALEQGRMVGILADRTISEKGTVRCDFLGAPAALPTGPLRLAAVLGRPVVLMFCVQRSTLRYEVFFERMHAAPTEPGEPRGASLARSVQAFADRLEHHARLAPYNWFNFYDFWK